MLYDRWQIVDGLLDMLVDGYENESYKSRCSVYFKLSEIFLGLYCDYLGVKKITKMYDVRFERLLYNLSLPFSFYP